jgi:hypothetical protein
MHAYRRVNSRAAYPDATLGLATFQERDVENPVRASELLRGRLEKLLLHRKCGLLTDPKWGETNPAFPFAAYEAKGWSGDCRVARRQTCVGQPSTSICLITLPVGRDQ